jgi:hypothetical protein
MIICGKAEEKFEYSIQIGQYEMIADATRKRS